VLTTPFTTQISDGFSFDRGHFERLRETLIRSLTHFDDLQHQFHVLLMSIQDGETDEVRVANFYRQLLYPAKQAVEVAESLLEELYNDAAEIALSSSEDVRQVDAHSDLLNNADFCNLLQQHNTNKREVAKLCIQLQWIDSSVDHYGHIKLSRRFHSAQRCVEGTRILLDTWKAEQLDADAN
jgi:hypothetical protein